MSVQVSAPQGCYSGPAGVVFTPEEILIIWGHLTTIPNGENASVREKCKVYLEGRKQ